MNISGWFKDTVSVKQRTGLGANGNPTYASASNIAARVFRKTQVVLNASGEQIQASHMVTLLTEVEEDDQIQLPGESFYRRAVAVSEGKDKSGTVTHYEVYL